MSSTKCILSESKRTEAKKTPQIIASLSVCFGAVSTGIVLGWTGNISDDLQAGNFNGIKIDDDALGWLGSLVPLGSSISCLMIGKMSDWIGRKYANLFTVLPFTIGWLLIIFAKSVEMMYIGRIITGFAGGALCVSAPLYIAEIAQKEIRGRLGTFFELSLTSGVLVNYIIGYYLSAKDATIVLAFFPIIFGIIFLMQPESPMYRMMQGREEEAMKILQRLRGPLYDIQEEIKEIREDLESDRKNFIPIKESLKKKETKIAIFVSLGLMLLQQANGENAIISYLSNIFMAAGLSDSVLDPKISTIIVGVVQVLANVLSMLVIDKLGRRILLILSGTFMIFSELAISVFFTLQDRNLVDGTTLSNISFIPLLSLCVFIMSCEVGYGPIVWIIPAEISPAEVRSVITSSAVAFGWFICFLSTKYFINMKNSWGADVTFYFFSVVVLLGTLFPMIFVPETKGRSLADIQKDLRGEKKENHHVEDSEK